VNTLVAVRAVHYVAIAQAFGALVFATAIARPRMEADAATQVRDRSIASLLNWSVAVALLSWLAWLALQASAMAGIPLSRALGGSTLWRVVHETSFGHVWLVRFALIIALAALLVLRRSSAWDAHRAALDASATLAGVAAIATLAATGHAAADTGSDKLVHITADAMHLIAAGAWLGALLPLIMALRATANPLQAHMLARRFSAIGMASVGVLIATSIVNSVYLVASWPALFGTEYGGLLFAKIALFVIMVALAATNRLRSTPQLVRGGAAPVHAAARIARNARLEAALGAGVLTIVAMLGVSVPAAHDQTWWPFPFRIAFDERTLPSIVSAYPTTYAHPPLRYTVTSIARGSALYDANCASCHGPEGHGDGPAAAVLTTKPADLASEHVLDHLDGDLYWWITHGIAGTPMPAFGAGLDERPRWDLVNFVKTIAAASVVQGSRSAMIDAEAPEFAYQIGLGPQQAISGASVQAATLLVLYALPQSRERLLELATAAPDLARSRIRVVAVPLRNDAETTIEDPRLAEIAATASPGLAETYQLFFRNVAPADRGPMAFLIDRDGWLRARWGGSGMPRTAEFVKQVRWFATEGQGAKRPTAHQRGH